MNSSTAVGIFYDRTSATEAVRALRSAGFGESQLGLIARNQDPAGNPHAAQSGLEDDPTGTRWEEGSGIGAAAGALTGTGIGLAVLAGLMPPLGPVIAGGALLALLASAGAGATVGTVLGGLIGLGISEEDAVAYDREFQAGRTLVTVDAGLRYGEALDILRAHGGTVRVTEATVSGPAM